MITVGVRELKQQTSQLIRRVRENGDEILVTHHGKVVARILPVAPGAEDARQAWENLDLLALEISKRWPHGVSAVQAVSAGRE
jgi:prevent-host-death family protein